MTMNFCDKLSKFLVNNKFANSVHHKFSQYWCFFTANTQPAFTCSKLAIETLEQVVKYVQS